MPDKKLTDNEIIKGLECCATGDFESCRQCPYGDGSGCTQNLREDALTLINNQQNEIFKLRAELAVANRHLTDLALKVGERND